MRIIAYLLMVMMLSGCATYGGYTVIEPQRTTIGGFYTIDPQIQWSVAQTEKLEEWTIDGSGFQTIHFFKGLDDGEVLFKSNVEERQPKFKPKMFAPEIMELVVNSLNTLGAQKVEVKNLRPAQFGNIHGFRFEISFASTPDFEFNASVLGSRAAIARLSSITDMLYVSMQGREREGFIVGAIVNDKLHLIMYSGLRGYYYKKYIEHVVHIVESIKVQ